MTINQAESVLTFSLYDSSYPANGSQKLVEIEDERKLRIFMEKRVRSMSLSTTLQPTLRASESIQSIIRTASTHSTTIIQRALEATYLSPKEY